MYICPYCGHRGRESQTGEEEHIIPLSRRGSDKSRNKLIACEKCNAAKGRKTPAEFAKWVEANNWRPDWPDADMRPFLRAQKAKSRAGLRRKSLGKRDLLQIHKRKR